jgi:hypothetical protein
MRRALVPKCSEQISVEPRFAADCSRFRATAPQHEAVVVCPPVSEDEKAAPDIDEA